MNMEMLSGKACASLRTSFCLGSVEDLSSRFLCTVWAAVIDAHLTALQYLPSHANRYEVILTHGEANVPHKR